MKKLKNKIMLAALLLVCGTCLSTPFTSNAAALYWPVPGHTLLSQGFHDGKAIDISDGSIAGADVIAAMGGKVVAIYFCTSQHYGSSHDCNGFGTGLAIKGDDGRYYQYAHMQGGSIPSNVYYNAYVSAGQKIGKVGTTGNSTGNHLHFGISLGNYWNNSGINPRNESYIYNGVHTHAYSNSITAQPTCTQQGVRTYRCSCGASYTEAVAAKGHQYVNKAVAPTLTEKGYTSHTCSACGNSYKDNYVEPPQKSDDGWYYSTSLPQGITAGQYDIQYQNYYEKIQKDSPGNGWKNAGTARNEWQNAGGIYTSATDLPTSDARVLVHSEYYHFCGPNAGNEGNYDQTGKFVHYDGVSADRVTARYLGTDNGHPYYFIYWKDGGAQISCQSGVTCDGSYGSHGNRCRAWYKMNTYQDRVQVIQYKFTKTSEWVNERDASASSVKVRFKMRKAADPMSDSIPKPEPTPDPAPDPEPTPAPEPAPARPLAVGKIIADAKSGGKYKVTSASAKDPTAAYIGTSNKYAQSITIPDSITYKEVSYRVTAVNAKALRNNKKVASIRLGDQVIKIGDSAFENCTKLKSVTVGSRAASIGRNAWKGCKSLKTVTIKSKALKKVGGKAFNGIHKKAEIIVPKAKLSAYKKLLKNKGQAKSVRIVR